MKTGKSPSFKYFRDFSSFYTNFWFFRIFIASLDSLTSLYKIV